MIYDCFTFFNELDLLEIRLNILDKHTDYFVLCESLQTFSGKPKSLNYLENRQRFSKWSHKIIHVVAPGGKFADPFQRAGFQKEYLKTGLTDAQNDDIIYFGDLDEIWRPQDIQDDQVYNLRQLNYSYYLNYRSSEEWVGTIVGKWKTIKTNSFNRFRANHSHILDNGGWHFTNMGGADQIRKKLEAYDHQEFNNEYIKEDIEYRMKNKEDYVGRSADWQGKHFSFHIDEKELPEYLLANKRKWKKLFQ